MVSRLERAVERIVEGTIARAFRLRVQPAEIGRHLERAMLDGRVTSVGTTLAPNLYEVRLHPEDAATFAGWEDALEREMETWLAEAAFRRGIASVGAIRVQVATDASVPRRTVRVAGHFSGGKTAPASPSPTRRQPAIRLMPTDGRMALITLDSQAVTVGRGEDNDLVLPVPEVSRHHARLEPAGAGWRVVDLGSRNGTWINGERVSGRRLAVGDEVTFGTVAFTVAE